MDLQQAAKVMGVSSSASPSEVEAGYQRAREGIEQKVVQAPTPALKNKLRAKLAELEAAKKALDRATIQETPGIQPNRQGGNFLPNREKGERVEQTTAHPSTASIIDPKPSWGIQENFVTLVPLAFALLSVVIHQWAYVGYADFILLAILAGASAYFRPKNIYLLAIGVLVFGAILLVFQMGALGLGWVSSAKSVPEATFLYFLFAALVCVFGYLLVCVFGYLKGLFALVANPRFSILWNYFGFAIFGTAFSLILHGFYFPIDELFAVFIALSIFATCGALLRKGFPNSLGAP